MNNLAYVIDPNQWVDPMGLQKKSAEWINVQTGAISGTKKGPDWENWVSYKDPDGRVNPQAEAIQTRLDRQRQKNIYNHNARIDLADRIEKMNKARNEANRIMSNTSNLPVEPNRQDIIAQKQDYDNAKEFMNNTPIMRLKNNILNCQSMCKVFDYFVCNFDSGAGVGRTEVINLHNGNIYGSPTLSVQDALETIAKTQKHKTKLNVSDIMKKRVDPKFKMGGASVNEAYNSLKGMGINGSCVAGHILNKKDDDATNTDNFLKGLAVTVSGGKGIITTGMTVGLNDQTLTKDMMVGVEAGLVLGGGGKLNKAVTFSNNDDTENFALFDILSVGRK